MDVYIPTHNRLRPGKLSSFTFVRYKLETELIKAVTNVNNRIINGRNITVKKSAHRWKAQRSPITSPTQVRPKDVIAISTHGACRDNRSYKKVLLGPKAPVNILQNDTTFTTNPKDFSEPNPSTNI
ncbi:hypothetical protein REPUB_Repub18cG0089800 [Reevesia pubescens]